MGTEPLKTLGDFRSGRVLGWNARSDYKRELMFGWNLVRAWDLLVCTPVDVRVGLAKLHSSRLLR